MCERSAAATLIPVVLAMTKTEEHVVRVFIDEGVARCRTIRRNAGENLLGRPFAP